LHAREGPVLDRPRARRHDRGERGVEEDPCAICFSSLSAWYRLGWWADAKCDADKKRLDIEIDYKNERRLSVEQLTALTELTRMHLKTARAYRLRLAFQEIYNAPSLEWGELILDR
jgi:hypothetical protein